MTPKAVITIILAVSIAGCATSSDPRQGGFFGGLYGLSSGAYEDRINTQKKELARQQEVNRDLQENSKMLEREAESQDRKLATEQQRLAIMKKKLLGLELEIDRLNAKSAQQKREMATLKHRINDLRRRLDSQQSALDKLDNGRSEDLPERYRLLQQERDRLAEEYRNLLEYFKSLSEAAS